MIIINNISDFFDNSAIIFVNSKIKKEKTIILNDLVFFIDSLNKINSINILNAKKYLIKNKKFYVDKIENYALIKQIANENNLIFDVPKKFVYAEIKARKTHPKSEKLFVLNLFDGTSIFDIVTNTLETEQGRVIVIALPGSTTFSGKDILEGKVLDINSPGMVVSYRTLGINKDGLIFGTKDDIGKEFEF
ncbi:TyrS-associated PheT N-terminal domain-related protein TapR [Mycoplasmopsis cynos]|uniref:TyrS-associated PheT N-terminal domain-related protein TapR n=1 Tax=Mycoplasmopsis cynos TaxID=171284 RepID=UPI002AFF18A6|nr:hypothetical protein [Mycoplasmopsis cynos]WQQ14557.1 hypothetical protein RRG42_03035 [Mycoplasmopsis cynos]